MQRSTITSEQSPPIVLDRPEYLTHQQILVVMAGLLAGMLLAALDQSSTPCCTWNGSSLIVGVALPRIVSELGGLDQLSWVVIAYLLATTATTPLWGKISDLYGRRLRARRETSGPLCRAEALGEH